MTEQEAMWVLKDFEKQVTAKADGAYQSTIGKMACDVAISALEEIQQYRALGTAEQLEWCKDASHWKGLYMKALEQYQALGTLEELQEAREKQVPKKHYIETEKATGLHEDYDCYECPNCDSFLGHVSDCKDENYRYNYCPNCGQAIDWS